MTFTLTTEQVLWVCGLISAIGGASVYIKKLIEVAKKPNAEQNRLIAEHGRRIDKLEADIAKDKANIGILSTEMHLLIKATHALLKHGIDGNSIEPMEESQAEIDNYLIHK
ncbi:MAG: hypothetical protein IKU47_03300 [Oscillospiraceae bacterium]|nr:hypothetical protein [Oscillospiraceae bacterium]